MQSIAKTQPCANQAPILVTTEKWHTIDVATDALQDEYALAIRLLGEAERRQLLRVNIANAAFAADYVTLLQAQPALVPALLQPADTLRDWQTRQELVERLPALQLLVQEMEDTIAGLEIDCYAAALNAYRALVRSGLPAGARPAFDTLRAHMARRLEKTRQTQAANRALQAAKDELNAAGAGRARNLSR